MAGKEVQAVLDIARRYEAIVVEQYQVEELYLFGSYAKGTAE